MMQRNAAVDDERDKLEALNKTRSDLQVDVSI